MFVALFFSVDGSAVAARNPADCPVQQGANDHFRSHEINSRSSHR